MRRGGEDWEVSEEEMMACVQTIIEPCLLFIVYHFRRTRIFARRWKSAMWIKILTCLCVNVQLALRDHVSN